MPDAETDGPIGDLWIASVVPSQLQVWQSLPNVHCLSLADVPLAGMYPTLGIDRALAVVGAIASVGAPVLVIDGGTALTFNGAVPPSTFLGGAILPGLGLQIKALHQGTAALPELAPLASGLPGRWAQNTEAAIAAGVVYTLLASIQSFVEDWQQRFPASAIVITGGDSDRLHTYLQQTHPDLAAQILVDPYLVFRGMQIVKQGKTTL
jgi:type III pantothenate kinase